MFIMCSCGFFILFYLLMDNFLIMFMVVFGEIFFIKLFILNLIEFKVVLFFFVVSIVFKWVLFVLIFFVFFKCIFFNKKIGLGLFILKGVNFLSWVINVMEIFVIFIFFFIFKVGWKFFLERKFVFFCNLVFNFVRFLVGNVRFVVIGCLLNVVIKLWCLLSVWYKWNVLMFWLDFLVILVIGLIFSIIVGWEYVLINLEVIIFKIFVF